MDMVYYLVVFTMQERFPVGGMKSASSLPNEDQLESLVDAVYNAALLPREWPAALKALSEAFSAAAAGIQGGDKASGELTFAITHNMQQFVDIYANELLPEDPRVGYSRSHPGHRCLYDYLHTSEKEMERSPYYRLFERESGLRYYVGSCCLDTPAEEVYFSLHFTRRHGHVDRALVERFGKLQSHIARAVSISRQLDGERLLMQALGEAVDNLTTGVVLVSHSGQVVQANSAAESVFGESDGLTVTREGVRAARPADQKRLREAIAGANNAQHIAEVQPPANIAISRPSGALPYDVLVAPTRQSRNLFIAPLRKVAAILLINRASEPQGPAISVLGSHFELTPAEVRLCRTISDGSDISSAASRLGIATSTARTRLKEVMAKTRTRRQAELVALLNAIRPESS